MSENTGKWSIGSKLAVVVVVAVLGLSIYGATQAVIDGVEAARIERSYETALKNTAQKSPAHQFLVKHLLQCKSGLSSDIECYSAIRNVASINGEAFVLQVDAAAKELNLL